jgi:hypothetical protein
LSWTTNYEHLFKPASLSRSLREARVFARIELNVQEQLEVLNWFDLNEELKRLPTCRQERAGFYYRNGLFGPGDAKYLYNMIRL